MEDVVFCVESIGFEVEFAAGGEDAGCDFASGWRLLVMVTMVEERRNSPVCNEDSLYWARLDLDGHVELVWSISEHCLEAK